MEHTSIHTNFGADAYGLNRHTTPKFRDCNGGCSEVRRPPITV